MSTSEARVGARSLDDQIGELGAALSAQIPQLAKAIAEEIHRDMRSYAVAMSREELTRGVVDSLRFILQGLKGDQDFDTSQAVATGAERAIAGVPLASVMEGYLVMFHFVWDAVITESKARPEISTEAVLRATEQVWMTQHAFTQAMSSGYRDQRTKQLLQDQDERAALVEALLLGPTDAYTSVWEISDLLRFPNRGLYRVVAAKLPSLGKTALPEIETKLRSLDIVSAWRLLPDLQVGIVAMPSAARDTALFDLLTRISCTRVGLSPAFEDLTRSHEATRYARLALGSRVDNPDVRVTEFTDTLLGRAAVSSPQLMQHLAHPLLSSFDDLSPDERQILAQTFHQWVNDEGSILRAAEHLFCHPNTVRHRLKRIEERTHRSLSRPSDLAELCLVFEIDLRLPREP